MPTTAPPRIMTEFSQMRERYRPLLIAAGPRDLAKVDEQVNTLLMHRADLLDRDVVLIPFLAGERRAFEPGAVVLLGQEEPSLRHRFHIKPDQFTVILIGKDGGEKFRSLSPVTTEQINQVIDAMPMRREEVRSRKHP